MKKESFTKKSDSEITAGIESNREALRAFRFGSAGSKTKNVRAARVLRRDVARMLTEENARKAKKA